MPVGEHTGYYIIERALDRHRAALRIKLNDRYVRLLKKQDLTHWDDDLISRYETAAKRLYEQSEPRIEREAMASPKYVRWECQRQRDLLLKQFLKRPKRVRYRRLIWPKGNSDGDLAEDLLDKLSEFVANADYEQQA